MSHCFAMSVSWWARGHRQRCWMGTLTEHGLPMQRFKLRSESQAVTSNLWRHGAWVCFWRVSSVTRFYSDRSCVRTLHADKYLSVWIRKLCLCICICGLMMSSPGNETERERGGGVIRREQSGGRSVLCVCVCVRGWVCLCVNIFPQQTSVYITKQHVLVILLQCTLSVHQFQVCRTGGICCLQCDT